MIMIILENAYTEIISRWYIDSVVKEKKTIWVLRLSVIYEDVTAWKEEDSSLYEGHKLFLSKGCKD